MKAERESRTTTTAVTKAAVKPRQERFMDIHLQAVVSGGAGGTRTTTPFEVSLSSICLAQCFVSYETGRRAQKEIVHPFNLYSLHSFEKKKFEKQ